MNAVDDMFKEGEAAAYKVFAWQTGTFEFRPEAPTGNHTIEVGTDAVMLESARQQDEAAAVKGDGRPQAHRSECARTAWRSSKRCARRSQRVTGEARDRRRRHRQSIAGVLLFSLQLPGDRLVYRPGMRRGFASLYGEWQEIGEQPLSPPVYQELRSRLIDSRFGGATDSGRTRRILLLRRSNGRARCRERGSDRLRGSSSRTPQPIQPEELGIDRAARGHPRRDRGSRDDRWPHARRRTARAPRAGWCDRHAERRHARARHERRNVQASEGPGVVLHARPHGLSAALRTVSADWVSARPQPARGRSDASRISRPRRASWRASSPRHREPAATLACPVSRPSCRDDDGLPRDHVDPSRHDGARRRRHRLAVLPPCACSTRRSAALALAGKTGALAEALERPRGEPKAKLQLHRS